MHSHEEGLLKRSIASIDMDWIIHIVMGHQQETDKYFDPGLSQSVTMGLMANGEIIFSLQE